MRHENSEAIIYTVSLSEILPEKKQKKFLRLLCDREKAIMTRFLHRKDRDRYLVTRALQRKILSKHTGLDATKLKFSKNSYGKPYLSFHQTNLPIQFNISHTRELIAIAITLGHQVGIDIERIKSNIDILTLAKHFFSYHEYATLLNHPYEMQSIMFFRYWTLKEAYIKALGIGLSMPLNHFHFDIRNTNNITLHSDDAISHQERKWAIEVFDIANNHFGAIVIDRTHLPDPPTLKFIQITPFE